MAYNQNIPQATDKQNQSQADILANFQALAPWGTGYGQFTLQASAPTFAAGINGIYNLLNATTSKNELYVKKQSNDAPTAVPFTASKMSNNTMANSASGWAYLASGVLLKWGIKSVTSSGATTIDSGSLSGGPSFNYNFRAILTPYSSAGTPGQFQVISKGFTTTTSGILNIYTFNASASTGVEYLFIGV